MTLWTLASEQGCGPVHGAFSPACGLNHENSSGRFENDVDRSDMVCMRNGVQHSGRRGVKPLTDLKALNAPLGSERFQHAVTAIRKPAFRCQ